MSFTVFSLLLPKKPTFVLIAFFFLPRKNLGTDPSLPASLLLSGADDFGRGTGQAAISSSTQQFHRILHLSVSSGEYEKLSQVPISV